MGLTLYSQITAAASAGGSQFSSGPPSPITYILLPLLYTTSYLLAFALGVVTITSAAQDHWRRWFIPLLPLTVLVGYADFSSSIINYTIVIIIFTFSPPTFPRGGLQNPTPTIVSYIPLLILALPVALALTALAYTRGQRVAGTARASAGGRAGEAGSADDELEVSSLDTPLDVMRWRTAGDASHRTNSAQVRSPSTSSRSARSPS